MRRIAPSCALCTLSLDARAPIFDAQALHCRESPCCAYVTGYLTSDLSATIALLECKATPDVDCAVNGQSSSGTAPSDNVDSRAVIGLQGNHSRDTIGQDSQSRNAIGQVFQSRNAIGQAGHPLAYLSTRKPKSLMIDLAQEVGGRIHPGASWGYSRTLCAGRKDGGF